MKGFADSTYNPRCTACPLHRLARRVCVPGEGPVPSDLMLVGMNPGAKEDLEGRPFVGPAGRILNQALDAAGLDRSSVFLTNSVKCFSDGKIPSRAEIRTCTDQYLKKEIAAVRPSLIVALGDLAMLALTDRRVGKDHRGKLVELRTALGDPTPVLVTYHPSALQHGGHSPRIRAALVNDLRSARAWIEGLSGKAT